MKAYTDREQSLKLAEILPLESADMRYTTFGDTHPWVLEGKLIEKDSTPCWSLAALLEQVPERLYDKQGTPYDIEITKNNGLHYIFYEYANSEIYHHINISCMNTLLDACYEIILQLHELKKL